MEESATPNPRPAAVFPPLRILVRGVNWLGDAVMATPARKSRAPARGGPGPHSDPAPPPPPAAPHPPHPPVPASRRPPRGDRRTDAAIFGSDPRGNRCRPAKILARRRRALVRFESGRRIRSRQTLAARPFHCRRDTNAKDDQLSLAHLRRPVGRPAR